MNLSYNETVSYAIALLFALLVHAVVIGLISFNWQDQTKSYTELQPYYIEATVVAENPYTAKKQQETDQAQQKLQQKLRERRETEARLKQDQAKWEKAQKAKAQAKAPEPVPLVAPLELPKPVPKTPPVKKQPDFASEIAQAMAREENARKAVTDDEKAMAYVGQIQREIVQNWSRPPSARNGMEALLRVRLIPTGEVIDVRIEKSSGNDSFDRSAVLAVSKAQRFQVPSDSLRFERDFREFTVLFRPDDLRL